MNLIMSLNRYFCMRFLTILFIFFSHANTAYANSSLRCSTFLTKKSLSPNTLNTQLNNAYRKTFSLKTRFAIAPELKFSMFRPFSVSDGGFSFFPEGRLPKLVSPNDVVVFKMSREQGIRQLRMGINLEEERAWIFVPAIDLWIYDSVNFADSNNVGTNSVLKAVLIKLFGNIELFHTHTNRAINKIYGDMPWLAENGQLTLDQFKPAVALPSFNDINIIIDSLDLRKGEAKPKYTGFIVHEFGMTEYSLQAFPYIANGEKTGIYPGISTWAHIDVLDQNISPTDKIRLMFELAEASSTKAVNCMLDICNWTPETAPRLFLKHIDL